MSRQIDVHFDEVIRVIKGSAPRRNGDLTKRWEQIIKELETIRPAKRWGGTIDGVLQHRILFHYNDVDVDLTSEQTDRLRDEAEERSKAMILEGYHSGELSCMIVWDNDGTEPEQELEFFGWWEIDK